MRFLVLLLALLALPVETRAEEAPMPYFLIVLHPAPGKLDHFTDADKAVIGEHFKRLQEATRQGIVVLAGPTDPPELGLVVLKAKDLAAAKAFAAEDPAVKAGTFVQEEVRPYHLALERTAPFGGDYAAPQGSKILHKEIVVKAPLAAVWRAWSTSEGLKEFLETDTHVDLRLGGPFEIYFNDKAAPGERGSENMRILSFVPERMISFEWNAPPSFGPLRHKRTWVTVMLAPDGADRVKVTLDQNGWGNGEDWDKLYAYFDHAWGSVLGALAEHFKAR